MAGQTLVNGVAVDELRQKAATLGKNPELACFRFRVHNRWINGGHSQTVVKDFHAVGESQHHSQEFTLEADEPPVLLGQDTAPNPVEHLLNALVTCLTGSMVYHAALRGIRISEIWSTVEGDLDVRGFMGLDPGVRKGYENIRVSFRVKSDAPSEKLEECARFSPVLDVVTNGTRIDLQVETV